MLDIKEYLLSNSIPEPNTGCRIWLGGTKKANNEEYGQFWHPEKKETVTAYEESYEAFVGPVPIGHILHHKCEVALCIEATHLQPVTRSQHKLLHSSQRNGNCIRGHSLAEYGHEASDKRRKRGYTIICKKCKTEQTQRDRRLGIR